MSRGLSGLTDRALGLAGLKLSSGQERALLADLAKVGCPNAAEFVCQEPDQITAVVQIFFCPRHTVEGYTGTMNWLLVAVAYRPRANFALADELAAASADLPPEALFELLLLDLIPTTIPTIAPMTTKIPIGIPNLTNGLVPFFCGEGVMYPVDWL